MAKPKVERTGMETKNLLPFDFFFPSHKCRIARTRLKKRVGPRLAALFTRSRHPMIYGGTSEVGLGFLVPRGTIVSGEQRANSCRA
jgi:hypothetical protein